MSCLQTLKLEFSKMLTKGNLSNYSVVPCLVALTHFQCHRSGGWVL